MRGSIKKEGNGYRVVYDLPRDPITGRRRQKKKRFKTKKEAEKYLNEQLNAINKGSYFEPKNMIFGEYLDFWLENYAIPNTSARTVEGYSYIINQHVKPALGSIKISDLQPLHLQEYYSMKLKTGKIDGSGLSAQSVKHQHRLISKALKEGVKWQFLARNVAEAVTPPKTKRAEMMTWNSDQVKAFLVAAKLSVYYPVYLTTIYTGMRKGEVLGLRWQDLDSENNVLYVRQTLQPIKGQGLTFKEPKTGKGRSVTVSSSLVKELKKIYKKQLEYKLLLGEDYNELDLIFSQKNGNPIQPAELSRNFHKIIQKVNIPDIRFHDLRHTHATLMLQQGIHPKVVSERLGHSTIGITMDTYTHVLPTLQKEAAQQFEQLIK